MKGNEDNSTSDNNKWVVILKGTGKGWIITDASMVAEMIGVSTSTLGRRIREYKKGDQNIPFEIKNYRIVSMPYYKSKRGK